MEKLKHPVDRGRRKQKRRESGVAEEKADLASLVPQPEPHAVAEASHDREGNGTVVEASQENLHHDVEVEVENGPSQQGDDLDEKKTDQADPPTPPPNSALDSGLDPPTSAPSTSYHGEPDSM